ncbi:hypothetical protein VTN31DRAFT_1857 [Thermomyces dupontii]|uniref:uncharacterized protein n=1 Tax=Talaromyces thermophilus TaxID=28565 RepID=UPI003742DF5E
MPTLPHTSTTGFLGVSLSKYPSCKSWNLKRPNFSMFLRAGVKGSRNFISRREWGFVGTTQLRHVTTYCTALKARAVESWKKKIYCNHHNRSAAEKWQIHVLFLRRMGAFPLSLELSVVSCVPVGIVSEMHNCDLFRCRKLA